MKKSREDDESSEKWRINWVSRLNLPLYFRIRSLKTLFTSLMASWVNQLNWLELITRLALDIEFWWLEEEGEEAEAEDEEEKGEEEKEEEEVAVKEDNGFVSWYWFVQGPGEAFRAPVFEEEPPEAVIVSGDDLDAVDEEDENDDEEEGEEEEEGKEGFTWTDEEEKAFKEEALTKGKSKNDDTSRDQMSACL